MHVISRKALEQFWLKHPAAKAPLYTWYRVASSSDFANFAQIKQAFNSADYVPPFVIFDVGGNNFRIVAVLHFNRQRLYIREVLTHAEYDRWSKSKRSKKS